MELYKYHKFQKMLSIPAKKLLYLNTIESKIIPIEWQLILINDGSFTQNLNSLTGKNIKLNTFYKTSDTSLNQKKNSGLFGLKIIKIIN